MPAKAIIVGWNAADWQLARPLLARGWMPALAGLIEAGATADLRGFAPFDPGFSWRTLATGTHPDDHLRNPPTLWARCAAAGQSAAVAGWPGADDVYPAHFQAAALRVTPAELDPGLLGLFLPAGAAPSAANDPHFRWLLEQLARVYTVHNVSVVLARSPSLRLLTLTQSLLSEVPERFLPLAADPRYAEVVTGAYRLMDVLLADLLRVTDRNDLIAVVSDHGGPRWVEARRQGQRPTGLSCWTGPGFKPGTTLATARLADLAPTIANFLGLPPVASRGRSLQTDPGPEPTFPGATAEPAQSQPSQVTDGTAFRIGIALVELDRREDAVPWLHRSLLANPESSAAALALARCLVELGLLPEALDAGAAALDLGDDDPSCRILRAKICLEQQHGAEALRWLAPLSDEHRSPEAAALVRRAQLAAGDYGPAAAGFSAALEFDPEEPLLWLGLGYARLGLGERAAALAALERAETLAPASPAVGDLRLRFEAAPSLSSSPSWGQPPAIPSWSSLTVRAQTRTAIRAGLKARQRAAEAARASLRAAVQPVRFVVAAAPARTSVESAIVITGATDGARSQLARLLARCGLPVLADGVRRPDAASPAGYLEWEPIRTLMNQPRLLAQAAGRGVVVPLDWLRRADPTVPLLVLRLVDRDERELREALPWPSLPIDRSRLETAPAAVLAEIDQFIGPGKLKRIDRGRPIGTP